MKMETKLVEEMGQRGIKLNYDSLRKWRESNENVLLQVAAKDGHGKGQSDSKKSLSIYYAFQAFYFAFTLQNIETVTLRRVIYPCWRDVIGRCVGGTYDVQHLEVIGGEEHAQEIINKAMELQQLSVSRETSGQARCVLLCRYKEAALHGSLEGVNEYYPPTPYDEEGE